MLSNSQKFQAAHAITRSTIRTGDNYSVTFSASLSLISAAAKGDTKALNFLWTIGRTIRSAASANLDAAYSALSAGHSDILAMRAAAASAAIKNLNDLTAAANAVAQGIDRTVKGGRKLGRDADEVAFSVARDFSEMTTDAAMLTSKAA